MSGPHETEGIEVLLCTSDGFTFVPGDEIAELMAWSDGIDSEIMRLPLDLA